LSWRIWSIFLSVSSVRGRGWAVNISPNAVRLTLDQFSLGVITILANNPINVMEQTTMMHYTANAATLTARRLIPDYSSKTE